MKPYISVALSIVAFALSACSFDPMGDLTCSREGVTEGERQCRDGVWVSTNDLPDTEFALDLGQPDQNFPTDVPTGADSGPLDDMTLTDAGPNFEDMTADLGDDMTQRDMPVDMPCEPDEDVQVCAAAGKNCGTVELFDGCQTRDIDCGMCPTDQACSAEEENVCGCMPESVCTDFDFECGMVDLSAQCPNVTDADCGDCGPAGTCSATRECECEGGYEYDSGMRSCVDIDECVNGTAMCDPNAVCTNLPGSFDCTCAVGYFGDGFACNPVPSIGEVVEASSSGTSTMNTQTMTATPNSVYVAFVNVNTTSWGVDSVTAFNESFTEIENRSACDDQHFLEIWTLETGSSVGPDGPVTLEMANGIANGPFGASIVVVRIDDAASIDPVIRSATADTSTPPASCLAASPATQFDGSTDADATDSIHVLAWAHPGSNLTLNAPWNSIAFSESGTTAGRQSRLSAFSLLTPSDPSIDVKATFSPAVHHVAGVVEIIPEPIP